jgi:hypothetical protein
VEVLCNECEIFSMCGDWRRSHRLDEMKNGSVHRLASSAGAIIGPDPERTTCPFQAEAPGRRCLCADHISSAA